MERMSLSTAISIFAKNHTFVVKAPDGYDLVCNERVFHVSNGYKVVALARDKFRDINGSLSSKDFANLMSTLVSERDESRMNYSQLKRQEAEIDMAIKMGF